LSAAYLAAQNTRVEMRSVNQHFDDKLVLEVHRLSGTLTPLKRGMPPTFDDKNSFRIDIDSAIVGISSANLTYLMNHYVFNFKGAPIKDLSIEFEGDQIKLKGTVHKGVDLPFEMAGSVQAPPEGLIRIHADKIKAEHIPIKGALKVLGLKLSDVLDP